MSSLLLQEEEIKDFESLISPLDVKSFANEYWGKKVLHIERGDREYYHSLLTKDGVDDIIFHGRPKGPSLRIVKNQVPLHPQKYENLDGSININQMYTAYADGYSIIIHEIQRFSKPIARLCANLQKEFNFRTLGEMFLTPKNQKALAPHYDAHDVFVVQLEGTKYWRLYDKVYEMPLVDSQQPVFDRKNLSNVREIKLEAGDVLFIPRGVPHEASTQDESSLHLSIGVHPMQWLDLVNVALADLAQTDLELRKPLPLGYSNQNKMNEDFRSMAQEKLSSIIEKATTKVNAYSSVRLLSENLRLTQGSFADGHFAHLDKLDDVDINTSLRHREAMNIETMEIAGFSRILFPGNVVKGPAAIYPCFEFIANAKEGFRVSEIPLVNDEGKIKIAKRLIRGGLLKIANNRVW